RRSSMAPQDNRRLCAERGPTTCSGASARPPVSPDRPPRSPSSRRSPRRYASIVPVDDARLEELLDRLRTGGGRVTEPRRAVLEVLLDTIDEHLSVEELAELVHRRRPDVHRSTVYRTLEAFEEANLVQHVHLGHSPSTY